MCEEPFFGPRDFVWPGGDGGEKRKESDTDTEGAGHGRTQDQNLVPNQGSEGISNGVGGGGEGRGAPPQSGDPWTEGCAGRAEGRNQQQDSSP